MKFAREVKEPSFEARAVIAGKDARTLATEILAMSEGEFRATFKGSAIKRAKLKGLRRNAGAALEISSSEDKLHDPISYGVGAQSPVVVSEPKSSATNPPK